MNFRAPYVVNWGFGCLGAILLGFYLITWIGGVFYIWGCFCCASLGFWVSHVYKECCSDGAMWSNWIGIFWEGNWVLLQCVCVWIIARTCNSRSGETCRGVCSLFCSCISPRRCGLVLGNRSSRLGEYTSPKREFVGVLGGWLDISHRRDKMLFWAEWRLAQASTPRLSEISREDWWLLLNSSPRRGILILGEWESRPGENDLA